MINKHIVMEAFCMGYNSQEGRLLVGYPESDTQRHTHNNFSHLHTSILHFPC